MGAGASAGVEIPPEFGTLTDEQKKECETKYEALKAEGKTDADAIEILRLTVMATTETATAPSESAAVEVPLTGLLEAIEKALEQGKTPLIVDSSEDDKVNTYFSYRSAVLLDGKKMGLDKTLHRKQVRDILEEARAKLVSALKYGQPLVIAMTTSVTDFATTFNDATARAEHGLDDKMYFPIEIFDNAGRSLLQQSFLDGLFREADLESGFAVSRDPQNFQVLLTTRFQREDFEDYLFGNSWGLPKPQDKYSYIFIKNE